MVDILSLLEEGYGAQLQNGTASPSSTPRSDAATPPRPTETMQRLRDLAKGMQSKFGFVLGYRKDDRASEHSSSSVDGARLPRNTECAMPHGLETYTHAPLSTVVVKLNSSLLCCIISAMPHDQRCISCQKVTTPLVIALLRCCVGPVESIGVHVRGWYYLSGASLVPVTALNTAARVLMSHLLECKPHHTCRLLSFTGQWRLDPLSA